jgi:hypothetical protein
MTYFNSTKAYERIFNFISQLPVLTKIDAVTSYINILKKVDINNEEQYLKHVKIFSDLYYRIKSGLLSMGNSTTWITENVEIIYRDESEDEEITIPLSVIYLKTSDVYSRDLVINHMIGIFLVIENDKDDRNLLKKCKQDLDPKKYSKDDGVLDDVINSFMSSMDKDSINNTDNLQDLLINTLQNPNVGASINNLAKNMSDGKLKPESMINMIPRMQTLLEKESKKK